MKRISLCMLAAFAAGAQPVDTANDEHLAQRIVDAVAVMAESEAKLHSLVTEARRAGLKVSIAQTYYHPSDRTCEFYEGFYDACRYADIESHWRVREIYRPNPPTMLYRSAPR